MDAYYLVTIVTYYIWR